MSSVAIVGAGELGGLLAHVLARRDAVSDIRLIDDGRQVAFGKALDIMQAAAIEQFATRVAGAADLSAAGGSTIVVLADRVGGSEWQGEDGLMLLSRLTGLISGAIVLCAGAQQRELVERGVRELHLGRDRLFGSAPEALTAAARAMIALEMNGAPRDAALSITGVPPDQIVVSWEDATIGGFAATHMLDEVGRRRVAARPPRPWAPRPCGPSCAAAQDISGSLR